MNSYRANLSKCRDFFYVSTAIVLVLTSLSKMISISVESKILGLPDPIFNFTTFRQLLLLTSIIELSLALYLYKGTSSQTKSFLIFWIGTVFISYRVGLWLIGYKGCSCLGTVTQWMPVAPATVDVLMKLILAYMTVGSAFFLIMELVSDKGKKPVENAHAD